MEITLHFASSHIAFASKSLVGAPVSAVSTEVSAVSAIAAGLSLLFLAICAKRASPTLGGSRRNRPVLGREWPRKYQPIRFNFIWNTFWSGRGGAGQGPSKGQSVLVLSVASQ